MDVVLRSLALDCELGRVNLDSEVPYVFVLAVVKVDKKLWERCGELLMVYVPSYLKAMEDPEWVLGWMNSARDRVMGVKPKEV